MNIPFPFLTKTTMGILTILSLSLAMPEASRADNPLMDAVIKESGEFFCLSPKEAELYRLINEHRTTSGLPPIANARSLNKVARLHAIDLEENKPWDGKEGCISRSLHSWSNKGKWKPVCYASDHALADAMWEKPREITGFTYAGDGFENVYRTTDPEVSPEKVLSAWKTSPSHNAVLLETGTWQGSNLHALGVGVYRNYAVIWVGLLIDPLGPMEVCTARTSPLTVSR